MSQPPADRLYNLLPAVYRIEDAGEGEPLRALLAVIEKEVDKLQGDIAGLYDNWFIETCDEWVVPYISDLLRVRGLHPLGPGSFSQRAYVANTLAYRRRKGTAAVLEQLARDVTGWPARAVEFFELLSTTQHMNHVRLKNHRTPDLRDINRLGLLNTPFDTIAHTGEVRHIDTRRGKYNIPNVGLFLWRLQSYAISLGTPRPADPPDGRYWFSPLGNDMALFTRPQTESEITHLADETNVPGPIRQVAFYFDLADYQARYASIPPDDRPANSIYYGPNGSLDIIADGESVPPVDVVCMDLRDWDRPPAGKVGVDVVRGRLAFPTGVVPGLVQVSYNYGFSDDIGGGPYDRRRRARLTPGGSGGPDTVATPGALGKLIRVPSAGITTLSGALAAWDPAGHPRTIIQVDDNRTYQEDLAINVAGAELVIQAANHKRPVLIGNITVTGGTGEERFNLNGLWIEGALGLQGNLSEVNLTHCTLVPGLGRDEGGAPKQPDAPSVIVAATNDRLNMAIDHSITGALRVSADMAALTVRDSIIDSPLRGRRAVVLPVLISGNLSPFPALGPGTPKVVNVTIGDDGPYPATLATTPSSLKVAREELQAAIRAAHDSPAFTGARVITVDSRFLAVLPGVPDPVLIEPAGTDATAGQLRLVAGDSRQVDALLGGSMSGFTGTQVSPAEVSVTIGDEGPHTATLLPAPAPPATLAQVRDQLQAAIRAAHTSVAFTGTLVGIADDRLVILPGTTGAEVLFGVTPSDTTTLTDLALESDRPAIAGSPGGRQPGPPATLERVTIFGVAHVRELTLASEVIFVDPVRAAHRQAGCVRFSYVAPGSRTPQCYRCQPALSVTTQTVEAKEQAKVDNVILTPAASAVIEASVEARVRASIVPSFTSTQYGEPAYAQLSSACPLEITTGAGDGSEMGVFSSLKQPQREANLRIALNEYLRFGLEAGIFYVS
ncbi:MAG TPA: hypothetical protein VEY08_14170 [Chloroflexia bacterium]|nr:hypothetical protein [Chloroflexia bacterium]